MLKEIAQPPLLLYVQGNQRLLAELQLAIVGARNATAYGIKNANEMAYVLAGAGCVITSGLALGIDAAAHKGALAAKGATIGVAGTGFAHIYPRKHKELVGEIIEQEGALVSEFPLSTPPIAQNFPRRNRIIAGLSRGVLVVEAALKSGSLITARYALHEGREVFAIPGAIHQPLSRGCHHLIQQGAKLVETATDILDELSGLHILFKSYSSSALLTKEGETKLPPLSPEYRQVFAQIGYEITPLDVIVLRSGLTASGLSSMLLTLELNGYIQSVPGGYIRTTANQ